MLKKVIISVLVLFLVGGVGFAVWGYTPAQPMPEALAALQSDAAVRVSTGSWIVFQPTGAQPDTGLIFYPGGRVDPRAYAPYLHDVAAQGYLVVLVPMPLNLAVFGAAKAGEVIGAYPQIENWAVGGHSLGGAMAANYVAQNPGKINGLLLLASYPAESDNLSDFTIQVISIYATEDGLATQPKIEASRVHLPADAIFIPILGGNHAQFGWYGAQNGDGEAMISRAEQSAQVVQATNGFLKDLGVK